MKTHTLYAVDFFYSFYSRSSFCYLFCDIFILYSYIIGWAKLPAHLVLLLSPPKLLSQLFFISVLLVTCITFPPFRLLGKSITVSSHNLNLQAPDRKMSSCFHILSFHVGLQLFLIEVLFLDTSFSLRVWF